MKTEIRRTGDNLFYLIGLDENGNSKELYVAGKLLKFDSSEEARGYLKTRIVKEVLEPKEQKGGKKHGSNVEETGV